MLHVDVFGRPVEQSLSRDEALDLGLLVRGKGSRVAPTIRIILAEDDGQEFGPVEIGDNTIIREGVVLSTGCRIGNEVLVGHNCVLRRRVQIGDQSVLSHLVSIQHDVVIGCRVRVSSLTHLTGGTIIEDDVQIGAGIATVDDNAMEWPRPSVLLGPTFRQGCRIGSGSTILGGVEIGRNTFIGAGSVVTRSMPENVVAFGNPAYVQRDRGPT
jgi:UDP-2-acetamido-3-amino-2,3-dideoxy-glucuronate N-acetyltransferase